MKGILPANQLSEGNITSQSAEWREYYQPISSVKGILPANQLSKRNITSQSAE